MRVAYSIGVGIVLSFLTTLVAFECFGQSNNLIFEPITIRDGLSQSTGKCITQDSKGYMWFGTEDGLNKYDGYSFTVYQHDPDLSNTIGNNTINCLHEDRLGNIWIGTEGGVSRLNPVTEQFKNFTHDDKNNFSLSSNSINSIYEDSSGEIWIGTAKGLERYDQKNEQFVRHIKTPTYVSTIIEYSKNMLWAGTSNGLIQVEMKRKVIVPVEVETLSDAVNNVGINYIYKQTNGDFWIGTEKGLYRFDKDSSLITVYSNNPNNNKSIVSNDVQSIYEDHNGSMWIGGQNGLSKFSKSSDSFTNYTHDISNDQSLLSNSISAIYEDDAHVLWVGTMEGVNRFCPYGKGRFQHYFHQPTNTKSLNNNIVFSLYEDNEENLWAGTYGGGLNKRVKETEEFLYFKNKKNDPKSLSNNYVTDINQDRDGLLWVATQDGLNKFDPHSETFTVYRNQNELTRSGHYYVFVTVEDPSGYLWVGTLMGLDKFDKETGKFTTFQHDPSDPLSISDNSIWFLFQDSSDVLWIGTRDGLNKYDESKGFVSYKHESDNPHSISSNQIMHITEGANGILWIGTNGGGLNRFDPKSEVFSHYTKRDGLSNNAIYAIASGENGDIWLSSNKGLTQFNTKTMSVVKNFDIDDGLQSNEYNGASVHKAKDGTVYFGGINGFNAFKPEDIQLNPYAPPVRITKLWLFNEEVTPKNEDSPLTLPIDITQQLTLTHKQNIFSLELTAFNYTNPELNQYAYYLEGLEEDWNFVGERRIASYTNLDAGEYVFRVKASNSDGVSNEAGVSLNISILPPWWRTWWFRTTVVVLIVLAITLFLMWKRNQALLNERDLREQVKNATEEMKNQRDELSREKDNLNQALAETNEIISLTLESGNLQARIDLSNKTGLWHDLADSINRLFDSITQPVSLINEIVRGLSEGNLKQKFEGEVKGDLAELTNNLNTSIKSLNEFLYQIRLNAKTIHKSSNDMLITSGEVNISTSEIATAIGEISTGAQNQQSKVDESSRLLEQVMNLCGDVSNQAQKIKTTSDEGQSFSDEGLKLIQRVDFTMNEISDFSTKTQNAMTELEKRSNEVTRVLVLMREVASQTNLLALNAAIEAAQAGDAGRGFAVVAEEIRRLSNNSKKSVVEIENLIGGIQSQTNTTAKMLNTMGTSILDGLEATKTSGESFKKLSETNSLTLELSNKIAEATDVQTQRMKEVVTLIETVVIISEETAAGTEEVSASSTQLSANMEEYSSNAERFMTIASSLKTGIEQFKLEDSVEVE